MKSASKNLARTLVLGSVLAGGVSLAQSFYNEAQASGSGGASHDTRTCMFRKDGNMQWGSKCDYSGSSCSTKTSCG
jgi:hypothetical protein